MNRGADESIPAIRLDITPMMSQLSTLVLIDQDGSAQAFSYSRNQLSVASVRAGRLPKDQQARIIQRIREIDFSAVCDERYFGGGGLSRGDQFQLSVSSQGSEPHRCLGFKEDAPADIQRLIDELLVLPDRLPQAALADSYVRSEQLKKERLSTIQRAGQMRVAKLSDFPSELRSILTDSLNSPSDFVPLNHQQYEIVRTHIAPDHEFILLLDNSGHLLTLFQAQPAPSSKGEKNGPPN